MNRSPSVAHPEAGGAVQSSLATRLAGQIVDLVQREGLPADAHLREEWLATQLRVSRSPVRKAMLCLEARGVVRKERNRGFFLAMPASALRASVQTADSDLEDDIYRRIADDRLNDRIGGDFTQAEIARRYGLTPRQTLRVLTRLEKEDLIGPKPGLGWEFHPVLSTVESLRQSYRFRMIIEPAAILEPTYRIDKKAFALHRATLTALVDGEGAGRTRADLNGIGSAFHEMIVGCSGNVYLLEALQKQNRMRRLMEYRNHPGRARSVAQAKEHLMLLDLIESGDRVAAADYLRRHLDAVRIVKTGT